MKKLPSSCCHRGQVTEEKEYEEEEHSWIVKLEMTVYHTKNKEEIQVIFHKSILINENY